jgi:soluble lytic murein transglycosylase-like protein
VIVLSGILIFCSCSDYSVGGVETNVVIEQDDHLISKLVTENLPSRGGRPCLNEICVYDEVPLNTSYQDIVHEYEEKWEIPRHFIYALIKTESTFNEKAVSSSNCVGLLQLSPGTYDSMVNILKREHPDIYELIKYRSIYDTRANLIVGIYHIYWIKDKYDLNTSNTQHLHKLLTIYNRGEGGAKKYYKENNSYVSSYSNKVIKTMEEFIPARC